MPSKILKCTCKHPGQDKLHGFQQRAHNQTKTAPNQPSVWRCTVCAKERTE